MVVSLNKRSASLVKSGKKRRSKHHRQRFHISFNGMSESEGERKTPEHSHLSGLLCHPEIVYVSQDFL